MPTFPLPEEEAIRIPADVLRLKSATLLAQAGVPAEDAQLAAEGLVSADLRGVDTHGAPNLLPWYLEQYRQGLMNPRPEWQITRETLATANIDSDQGLGLVIAPKAMHVAISKAREVGIGFVTMHNGRHLGMAQYHALLAIPHDMIGVCLTASGPLMVPTFGREPRLGTNPIAVAVPCNQEPAFVFDAATTVVAGNKVVIAHRLGMQLPPGILSEDDGTPIMHQIAAPSTYSRLLPLGSTPNQASHKGYGLGCAVDILTSLLGGLTFGMQMELHHFNHCVAAINIEAFTSPDGFKKTMDDLVRTLRETPPAPGQERVLVPGQIEWETEQERRSRGIPVHREFIDWLEQKFPEADW